MLSAERTGRFVIDYRASKSWENRAKILLRWRAAHAEDRYRFSLSYDKESWDRDVEENIIDDLEEELFAHAPQHVQEQYESGVEAFVDSTAKEDKLHNSSAEEVKNTCATIGFACVVSIGILLFALMLL